MQRSRKGINPREAAEGEVKSFPGIQRQKLDSVRATPGMHSRDAIYAVKVVDVGPMTTALFGRAVLLISDEGIDGFGDENDFVEVAVVL